VLPLQRFVAGPHMTTLFIITNFSQFEASNTNAEINHYLETVRVLNTAIISEKGTSAPFITLVS
jgi:hypothetical protein